MSFIQQNMVGILVGLMPALWVFPSGSEGCFLWRQIFEWARNRTKSSFISEGFSVELPIILLVGSGGSGIWLGSLPGTSWVRYSGHVLPRGDHGLKRPLGWMDGWMDFSLHNKCSTSVKMSWQLCSFHILSHLVYGKSNLKVKWIQKTQTERSYIKQLNKSKLSLCPHVWTDFLSCGRLDKMLLVSLLFSNTFLLLLLFCCICFLKIATGLHHCCKTVTSIYHSM